MSWSVFGHDPRIFFWLHHTPEGRKGHRWQWTRERERRGRFSRDECSVIATRGTSCSVPGNPRVSFVLPSPPPPPRAQSKLAPTEALDRCITDASLRIRRLNFSTQPRNSLESPRRLPFISMNTTPCVRPNAQWLVSIALHRSPPPLSPILFPLNGHRNFFRPRVERFFYSSLVSTCRKGEAFRNDGKTGGRGEKKCRSV